MYLTHIRNNYPYISRGHHEGKVNGSYDSFLEIAKHHRAIQTGDVRLVPDSFKVPEESYGYRPIFWYHAGYACFYQPRAGKRIILYDFHEGRKAPIHFTLPAGRSLASANVGGTPETGVYLVYCDYISGEGALRRGSAR